MTGGSGTPVPIVSNVTWAVVSLSFFAGAFNVEIFRSGIEAVPGTTIEAAESLGFTRLRTYLLIVLPLAFRISLPALNNNLVNLVKTTTLAYAIAVPELLYVSSQIWSDSLNVPEMMNVLLIMYFVLVGSLEWMNIIVMESGPKQSSLAKRIEMPVHGLDADQVLLTDFFGMATTRAPGKKRQLKELSLKARDGDTEAAKQILMEMSKGLEVAS